MKGLVESLKESLYNKVNNKLSAFVIEFTNDNVPSTDFINKWGDDEFKGWPLDMIEFMYEGNAWSDNDGYDVVIEVYPKNATKIKKWLESLHIPFSVLKK